MRREIIAKIAKKLKLSEGSVQAMYDEMAKEIVSKMEAGEVFHLQRVGNLEPRNRKARKIFNQEATTGSVGVHFTISRTMKSILNPQDPKESVESTPKKKEPSSEDKLLDIVKNMNKNG